MNKVIAKEIKKGIKSHVVETDLFKTNVISFYFTVPLKKEDVTKNALLTLMLKNGGKKYPTQYDVSRKLDKMYGANLSFGITKRGDNQILRFYIDVINNDYAFEKEDLIKESLELLIDIIFHPNTNPDGSFKDELLDIEKNNLRNILEASKDDKDSYAFDRCVEEMYDKEGYGLNKYGIIEEIDKVDGKALKEAYEKVIAEAKIDIFVSGNVDENRINEDISVLDKIKNLNEREGFFNRYDTVKYPRENPKTIEEKLNVVQGKLVIGLDCIKTIDNYRIGGLVFDTILGNGPNSMMFQNVREKEGLAYSARSMFVYPKMNDFIRLGILSENYEKALDLSLKQIDNIKNGDFTDEDLVNAKTYLKSGIRSIKEDQDTILFYYYGQELSSDPISLEEYERQVELVTKEDVIEFAKGVKVNTIYYLNAIEELGE